MPAQHGGAALLVAEVGGHGDHGGGGLLAGREARVGHEALEDQRRHRGRRPGRAVRHEPPLGVAHPAFDQRAHVLGVQAGLAARALADDVLLRAREQHDRRRGRGSGQPGEHLRSSVLADAGDGGVRRAEVDSVDGHGRSVSSAA